MKIQFESGQTVEFDGQPTPEDIDEVAKSLNIKSSTQSLVPAKEEDPSVMDYIFKMPSAAVRSTLMGKGPKFGWENYKHVPKFQDMAIQGVNDNLSKMGMDSVPYDQQVASRFALTLPASIAGFAADVATSPADMALMFGGKLPTGSGATIEEALAASKGGQAIGKVMNADLGKIPGAIAEKAMSLFTRSPELAENFVKSPDAYNINPFKKAPSYSREKEAADFHMQNLREDLKRGYEDAKIDSKTKIDDMRLAFADSKQKFQSGAEQDIIQAGKQIDGSLEGVQDGLENRLMKIYENTVKTVDGLHDSIGKGVETAIDNILAKDPEASVPYKSVYPEFEKILTEATTNAKIPFKISVDQGGNLEIAGRTSLTEPKDLNLLSSLFKDMNSVNQTSGYRIDFLQSLKGQLQEISSQYFNEGKGKLGQFYAELSRVVNPANIASKNPDLATKLPNLKAANSAYHEFKPKYEEILDLMTKKNANGEPVPDFRKVLKAVENNDLSTLKRMEQADSMLPPSDQVLPKVREAHRDMRIAQQTAKDELKNLKIDLDQKLSELQMQHDSILTQERGDNRAKLLSEARRIRELLLKEKRRLGEHLNFIEDQEALRKPLSMVAGNVLKGADKLTSPVTRPFMSSIEGLSLKIKSGFPRKALAAGAVEAAGDNNG